ncbi:MAG: hypothetical protein AAGD01_10470 [Acidobacteriota bacterium]
MSDYLGQLDALLSRVEKVDFQVSEDTVAIPLAAKFVPTVLSLLEDAVDLLGEIQEHFEADDAHRNKGEQDSSLVDIGALISSELAARSLADLSFVARSELKSCRQELGAAEKQNNFWHMASRCDTGLRRMRKALISVESSIYEYQSRKGPIRVWYDLDLSLQIRKIYGKIRRDILFGPVPEDDELVDRFPQVMEHFRNLRSLDLYPLLRIDDRVQMKRMTRRIADWLSQDPRDGEEGQRLWQDLTGFAGLLSQINNRQELREHDRQLIDLGRRVLRNRRKGGQLPEELLQDFENLLGLDDELDALILAPEDNLQHSWSGPLERLQNALKPRSRDEAAPF